MKKLANLLAMLLALLLVVAFVGCAAITQPPEAANLQKNAPEVSNDATEDASSGEKAGSGAAGKKVGFGLYFRNDQWWKDLEAESVAHAEELGFEILVQDGNQDANLQAGHIEAFVAQGVDAIMFAPIDSAAATQAVAAAKQKGIPVITLESPLDDASNVSSQLVFDQYLAGYECGKLAAEWMNEVHGGKGSYVCLNNPTANVVVPKCEGFAAAMEEFCPTAERVEDLDGKSQRDTAATATENALVAHQDLYVIFAGQTDMALAACAVLDAKDLDDTQYWVGGEGWGDEAYEELVNKKYMKAVCITPGVPLGVAALDAFYEYFENGIAFAATVEVPADIVTAENAKEYFGK